MSALRPPAVKLNDLVRLSSARLLGRCAAVSLHHCVNAHHQLLGRKGLYDIVVDPQSEAVYLVIFLSAVPKA